LMCDGVVGVVVDHDVKRQIGEGRISEDSWCGHEVIVFERESYAAAPPDQLDTSCVQSRVDPAAENYGHPGRKGRSRRLSAHREGPGERRHAAPWVEWRRAARAGAAAADGTMRGAGGDDVPELARSSLVGRSNEETDDLTVRGRGRNLENSLREYGLRGRRKTKKVAHAGAEGKCRADHECGDERHNKRAR
jgi:hypothetical protein